MWENYCTLNAQETQFEAGFRLKKKSVSDEIKWTASIWQVMTFIKYAPVYFKKLKIVQARYRCV